MTSTYAVTVECSYGGEDNAAYDDALSRLDEKVVDSVIRDDGSAVFYLEWGPEPEPDGGASTWQAAKASIEHIRSTFAGAGVLVGELRVGEVEVPSKKKRAAKG